MTAPSRRGRASRAASRGRCQRDDVSAAPWRDSGLNMRAALAHSHLYWVRRWLAALLVCLCAGQAWAADADLSWASLSGEQQYILSGYGARWAKLDLAARRALVARAETHRLRASHAPKPAPASEAAPADKKAPSSFQSSRRRRSLSAAEAGLSSHSIRLRRVLRDLPGLSVNERRALLERWGELSNGQRVALVDRYMHNVDDDDELALQESLRDGKLSHAELQRGLATGKLRADDIKEALAAGRLTIKTIKDGVASHAIVAEDLERTLRDGNIDSSELNNAIEHNRAPIEGAPDATPVSAAGAAPPP